MTAIGPIDIERWHGRCPKCRAVGFASDGVLGLTGWLTIRARRMTCKAGLHDPFRKAEELLLELSGWSIDAETLRRRTHAEAAQASRTRSERVGLPEAFTTASGDTELHIDAGKVNTPEGWRDVKVAVFAVRERGPSATSADYEQRELPAPAVRSVVAAVEEVGLFELRCQAEALRLGLTDPTLWSILGDGAEWIWNMADRSFWRGGAGVGRVEPTNKIAQIDGKPKNVAVQKRGILEIHNPYQAEKHQERKHQLGSKTINQQGRSENQR